MNKYLFMLPILLVAQCLVAQALTKNGAVVTESTVSTLKVGTVTYPATDGANGQMLTTNGSGVATWTTPTTTATAYSGVLPLENGGTGATTQNFIDLTTAQTIAGAKTFTTNISVRGVAIGIAPGDSTTNIVLGGALGSNTTGMYNMAIGGSTLFRNSTGSQNIAGGQGALENSVDGNNNAAIGSNALHSNTSGSNNTAFGVGALYTNTTGINVTAIGYGANVASSNLSNATAIGYAAVVSADNTIQLGNTAVTNVKTSGTVTADAVTYPNAHGTSGQVLSTTGSGILTWTTPSTTATAYSGTLPVANGGTGSTTQNFVDITTEQTVAGSKTFSSDINVNGITVGRGLGNAPTNVVVGSQALIANTSGDYNSALGVSALSSNTSGARNTAVGFDALKSNTDGSFNTAFGVKSLYTNTAGKENTSIGNGSMFFSTTGSNNTASGRYALYSNTTGTDNVGVGHSTGVSLQTGSRNTLLGAKANGAAAVENATAIGYGAYVLTNNTVQLGNNDVANVSTRGTLTAGTVTYPNTHNATEGQVLTTDSFGVASWQNTPRTMYSFMSKNADYTITNGDATNNLVLKNSSNNVVTFTLPSANAAGVGKMIYITSTSTSSPQSINVLTDGTDLFFGFYTTPTGTTDLSSTTLSNISWVQLISDGSSWNILGMYF